MADDFGAFAKRLDGIASELTGKAAEERMKKIGKLTERDVDEAVRADWPKQSLTNWRRKAPVVVTGHSELSTSVEDGLWITPGVAAGAWRRGFGPMRVMSDGRKASQFDAKIGHFRDGGLGKRRKDGTRRMKRRKVKGAYGSTAGRDTWADAEKLIGQNIGKRIHQVRVQDVLKRHFR